MPSTFHSASLQKMEGNGRRRKRFSCANIFGDPFALATTSIALAAWILSLVSSIISVLNNPYPKWGWWTIAFMFFCIVGVIIVIGADSARAYHVAIVGYLSAGIVMTSSAVSQTIYSNHNASEAAAAGFILQAVICIIWIFYFGSQPQATHRTYVDSFALHKDGRPSPRSSRQMSNRYTDQHLSSFAGNTGPQTYSTNHLAGFENATPGYPSDSRNSRVSQQPRFGATPTSPGFGPQGANGTGPTALDTTPSPQTEYKYRAKAIYAYEANPEDANEISFAKTEILEVSDVSGRWWQARKATGETGIAPSNYLILL